MGGAQPALSAIPGMGVAPPSDGAAPALPSIAGMSVAPPNDGATPAFPSMPGMSVAPPPPAPALPPPANQAIGGIGVGMLDPQALGVAASAPQVVGSINASAASGLQAFNIGAAPAMQSGGLNAYYGAVQAIQPAADEADRPAKFPRFN